MVTFTKQEIVNLIESLDGISNPLIYISLPQATFTVIGKAYDRVKVSYDPDKLELRSGWFIDKSAANDEREMFIRYDPWEEEHIPLNETISQKIAIEIIVYFDEHGKLPDYLTWSDRGILVPTIDASET